MITLTVAASIKENIRSGQWQKLYFECE